MFLKPDEIEYIALEGGGGKGFAYLGAIDALNEIEGFSFDRIKGYSGSSAGAISSMLLSVGITTKEGISEFMEKVKPDIFFDFQNFGKIPYPGEYKPSPAVEELKQIIKMTPEVQLFEKARSWSVLFLFTYLFSSGEAKNFNNNLNKLLSYVYNSILTAFEKVRKNILHSFKYFLQTYFTYRFNSFNKLLGVDKVLLKIFDEIKTEGTDTDPRYYEDIKFISNKSIDELDSEVKKIFIKFIAANLEIKTDILEVLTYSNWGYIFYRDKGLTPALEARNLFDETIAKALKISKKNITFQELWNWTPVEKRKLLKITGTNLTLGRTVVFSVDETPDFPVADAVRISMGLPMIFKPYEITEEKKGWPPMGVYVDGGVWNNLPSRLFDSEIEVQRDQADNRSYSIRPGKTLAIKLELPARNEITNVFSIVKTLSFTYGIFGSGETQIYKSDFWRTIFLDTEKLELLGFSKPEADTEILINKRSRRTVYRYFNLEPKAKDSDPADDAGMEGRHSRSVYSNL